MNEILRIHADAAACRELDMLRSMSPIFGTRAQTRHPCGQVECNQDLWVARFLLICCTVSATIQVKRVNTHHDMNPRRGQGLRWVLRLLHLIEHEDSRYGLP